MKLSRQSGQTLAPGFVDAHTHLYGVLAHGIPLHKAPSGFWPFLTDFWWPLVEDRLDHEMICAATDLNLAQMLRGGTTSFYDITEAPNALPGCLRRPGRGRAEARGIRGILSFEATERVSQENGQLGLRENLEFIRACQESGAGATGWAGRAGRSQAITAIHASIFHSSPVSCATTPPSPAPLTSSGRRSRWPRPKARSVHMHASEGTYEPEHALKHFGGRTFEYYDRLGVAGPSMQASQCVQITPAEIEIIAQRGVRVTHMPLSNCEVGGGIAPVPDLVAAGVTVGLGSDGYITDFFEVMRGAFLIHKAYRQDPRVMPASLVWQLATEGGARALGLEKVGRLAPGWQADLQLIDSTCRRRSGVESVRSASALPQPARCPGRDGGRAVARARWRGPGLDEAALRARAHAAAEAWQM